MVIRSIGVSLVVIFGCVLFGSNAAPGQIPATQEAPVQQADDTAAPIPDSGPGSGGQDDEERLPDFHPDLLMQLDGATPLDRKGSAYLDVKKKRVLLKTRVACNDCLLEMLVCTAGSKEHESVLSFDGKAYVIHTALLALGIKPGKPVEFSPKFQEPDGPRLKMTVYWRNKEGRIQSMDARKWMRTSVAHYFSKSLAAPPEGIEFPFLELRYDPYNKELLWFGQMKAEDKKTLLAKCDDDEYQKAIEEFYVKSQSQPVTVDFVFTGSHMTKRTEEGPEFYAAEDGYLICVANFASATIDVKAASSASDGNRSYEAKSDIVPPRNTPVILEVSPQE